MGKVAGGQVFQQVLRVFPVITIAPVLRTHFHSTIHRQYMTETSKVVK
jgi:hypothetical protein